MRFRLPKIEQTALEAVARHFSATLESGHDRAGAYLRVAGRPIALVVTAIESRASERVRATRHGLRFDRVALGLIERLRTALSGSVPDGETVITTITAPIKLPGKTAAALEDRIRKLLGARRAPARLTDTIHGNRIQAHVLKGGAPRTARLIGFVHNPDSDPAILLSVTRALLTGIGSGERATRSRWLVLVDHRGLVPIATYRQVYSQLYVGNVFEQTLVIRPGGEVVTLGG